jgi:hypothetical protein
MVDDPARLTDTMDILNNIIQLTIVLSAVAMILAVVSGVLP